MTTLGCDAAPAVGTIRIEIRHRWTNAVIYAIDLPETVLEAERIRMAVESAVRDDVRLCDAYLRDVDLSGAALGGADFRGAYLRGACFCGTDLYSADFSGADLRDANFGGANLSKARLGGADLRDAYFRGADLSGAYLCAADISDADFGGAHLGAASLDTARLDDYRIDAIAQVGPIGSRDDWLVAYRTTSGEIHVHTGCFRGSIDELEAAVRKTHGNNEHGRHYMAAIAYLRARLAKVGDICH